MKKIYLFFVVFWVMLIMLVSCKNDIVSITSNDIKDIISIESFESTSSNEQNFLSAYNKFLKGEINAEDPNGKNLSGDIININDICVITNEIQYTEYALFDMNGDGIPELHLRPILNAVYYAIFTYQDGKVILWYMTTHYCYPLNNGAIFYERIGIPELTAYKYIILDFYGYECYEIPFYKSEEILDGDAEYPGIYNYDGLDISKEMWDSLTEKLFAVKSDLIEWNNIGNISPH